MPLLLILGYLCDSQEIGMTFAFYAIPLAKAMGGYQWLFLLFSVLGCIVAFIPIVVLMYKGEAIRRHMDRQ